jgi:hypothetical protein
MIEILNGDAADNGSGVTIGTPEGEVPAIAIVIQKA